MRDNYYLAFSSLFPSFFEAIQYRTKTGRFKCKTPNCNILKWQIHLHISYNAGECNYQQMQCTSNNAIMMVYDLISSQKSPRGYKKSMLISAGLEFFPLINVKIPTSVGLLPFRSRQNNILGLSELEKCSWAWNII